MCAVTEAQGSHPLPKSRPTDESDAVDPKAIILQQQPYRDCTLKFATGVNIEIDIVQKVNE